MKNASLFPTFIVCGSTASGKTEFAIRLAEHLQSMGIDAEIINADSIQLYNELKILTAYPSTEELSRAKHNLYGILAPNDPINVAQWRSIACNAIDELKNKNKIPIVCGGTGFYINALIDGISELPDIPLSIRDEVTTIRNALGSQEFYNQLIRLDSSVNGLIHANDTNRSIRAYEIIKFTGKSITYWWKNANKKSDIGDTKTFFLLPNTQLLNEKCRKRAEKMVELGAINEVSSFNARYPNYSGPLMHAIGFAEITSYINGMQSLEDMINAMHIKTRQYAKRQRTWFKNKLTKQYVITDFGENVKDSIVQAMREIFPPNL